MKATAELGQTGNSVCHHDDRAEYHHHHHHHNNAASASHKANSALVGNASQFK
jgi:hypothetical protein